MSSRKIEALALIERIKRQALEEEAAALVRLRSHVAGLEAEKTRVLDDMRQQAQERSLEAAPYIPSYLRAVRAEETRLEAEIAKIEEKAVAVEDRVREGFREMKTYEQALTVAREAAAREAARREAAELDDIALMRHAIRPRN
ncbi:hypothetical protein FGG78_38705 [Thioclava sp. BHET1]|nr:hypothetical protein FGG78_38705 [Thioclava sp. BHET1]